MSPYSNLSFIFTPVYSLQWRGSKLLYAANAAVMPYTLQQRQTLRTPMSDVSNFGVENFQTIVFGLFNCPPLTWDGSAEKRLEFFVRSV